MKGLCDFCNLCVRISFPIAVGDTHKSPTGSLKNSLSPHVIEVLSFVHIKVRRAITFNGDPILPVSHYEVDRETCRLVLRPYLHALAFQSLCDLFLEFGIEDTSW